MVKPLANLVATLITPICQKSGFVKASLVIDWDKIVGAEYSHFCQALKVMFPLGKKTQGSLYVRVPSPMATQVSYMQPQILDKVNRYYGYQAIAKLVIQQGPMAQRKPSPQPKYHFKSLSEESATTLAKNVAVIPEQNLQDALSRLGASILERQIP